MSSPFLFKVAKYASAHKKNLRLSRAQIQDLQQKKFRSLVKFAAQNSPFYQQIIREKGLDVKTCTLADFPILTKEIMLENFDKIVTDRRISKAEVIKFLQRPLSDKSLFLDKYTVVNTSGSSGTVGYFLFNQEELACGVSHSTRANGLNFFQRYAFIGATAGRFAGISIVNSARNLPLLYQDVLTLDINLPMEKIIEQLNDFQPTCVSGYASILAKLALAKQEGKLKISPKLLNSSGEAISPEDQRLATEVFDSPLKNVYACTEHLIMGVGSQEWEGMYLMEDELIFELGEKSSLITNLYNYTLPLIRYQMNDVLIPAEEDKNPQMPFLKIQNLVARKEFSPVFLNRFGVEDSLHPIPLAVIFVKDVLKYQFHLLDLENFLVKVQITPSLESTEKERVFKEMREQIQAILDQKEMQNVRFQIKEVKNLWVDPKTGKFRLILQAQKS